MDGQHVSRSEWVDLVVSLRTARVCGTFGIAPPIHHNDPERNRIHEGVKQDVTKRYAGWISAGNCEERT